MSEHTTTATPDAARKDTGSQTRQKGAQILIENVTKRYGSGKAAVDHLTLEIPAGQTVMFVCASWLL